MLAVAPALPALGASPARVTRPVRSRARPVVALAAGYGLPACPVAENRVDTGLVWIRQADVTDRNGQDTPRRRAIGVVGTVARVVLGVAMIAWVAVGHFQPVAWVLGLLGFPAVLLAWQWLRARRNPRRFQATGPLGFAINIGVVLVLILTPWYLPELAVTSNAAQLFYGASMLVAAARGYAGCEVLALSNWVLGRDDQVGCVVFAPIDHAEGTGGGVSPGSSASG